MKELQNFVYGHINALRNHKRYLAILTALSLLVSFMVSLILIEPADSMAGVLICGKSVHTHGAECFDENNALNCVLEEHVHTEDCYDKGYIWKLDLAALGNNGNDENIDLYNAGSGVYDEAKGMYGAVDAHKKVNAEGYYNPATLPLYTLLFGEGEDHWMQPDLTLDQNLQIANEEYFLGYASDFCAFIESDFEAFDADAEGRVFIGGNLMFYGNPEVGEWNYQVGAGDFGHFIPIASTDEYRGVNGFASGIIGGKVYRLGTLSTGSTETVKKGKNLPLPAGRPARHVSGYDIYVYPEEGLYKRFVIGNIRESLHLDEDYLVYGDEEKKDIPYETVCDHKYYDHECKYCGIADLDTIKNEHSYLKEVNELAQFYQYDGVSTLLEKSFDTLRSRSLSLGSIDAIEVAVENNKLVLDASNVDPDTKTVYFKVNEWAAPGEIEIIVPENRTTKGTSRYTNNGETITELDLNIIVTCDDKAINIGGAKTTVTIDGGSSYQISNNGSNATNNHPLSSNILYNFPNATSVQFNGNCNFNGTIMAPNANVKSAERCPGHLSGALIAKSFYGGLEFGYRPYRGGADIFGMVSGYGVPVNKIDEGGSILPGALFAIKKDGKFVSLFESGSGTNFAALPSKVDYKGQYRQEYVSQDEATTDRPYAGTAVNGEKLTAPLSFKLYSDSACGNQIAYNEYDVDETTKAMRYEPGNIVTFYVKSDQPVTIDSNENFIAESIDGYTHKIQMIKPVNGNFDITVRNAADSTSAKTETVYTAPTMKLTVSAQNNEFQVGNPLTLTPADVPGCASTLYYQYFANGTLMYEGYKEGAYENYVPTAPGNIIYSAKAFVKVGDNYYEVAQGEAPKVEIKDRNLSEVGITVVNSQNQDVDAITSGEEFKIIVNNLPDGATVQYYFENTLRPQGDNVASFTIDTDSIAGKELPVKVVITRLNAQNEEETVERYDTITVNFNPNDGIAFDNDYDRNRTVDLNDTNYVVDQNQNGVLNFGLINGDYYNGATVTYYFNNRQLEGNTVPKNTVGDGMPVYAILNVKGLEKTLTGNSVTGKYSDSLGVTITQGPYIEGSDIGLELQNAPSGAKVIFKAYDSNNNVIWTSNEETVQSDGKCPVTYTPDRADHISIRAFMNFAGNAEREIWGGNFPVSAIPVTGEITVNPNQTNTGNPVELRVYGAPEGANVRIVVRDQYGNEDRSYSGVADEAGNYVITDYVPTKASTYTAYATITTANGSPREVQSSFLVRENTTTLAGNLRVVQEGDKLNIYVENATDGATVRVYVNGAEWTSGAINNGGFQNAYNMTNDGGYKISAVLEKNGQSLNLGEQSFTKGAQITGDISFNSNGEADFNPGKDLTVNLAVSGADGKVATFDIYYYGVENHVGSGTATVNGGTCSYTFQPAIKGDHLIIVSIDGVAVAQGKVRVNSVFSLDASQYAGGSTATITVHDTSDLIAEVQQLTIAGNAVDQNDITISDNLVKINLLSYTGEFPLYIRIKHKGGAITEWNSTIKIVDAAQAQSLPRSMFALGRGLNLLADGNIDPSTVDNSLTIKGENNEEIHSARLLFPTAIDETHPGFTLKATFKGADDADGNIIEERYYTKENLGNTPTYLDIDCPDNTHEIVLTATSGSITIDKCYPTFVKSEYKIHKTPAIGFELQPNVEKEIVLEDWARVLDTLTLHFADGNQGTVYYALVTDDVAAVPEIKSATIENGIITISNETGANITKIRVYTTEADSLTVTEYNISAFIGETQYSPEQLNALVNNDFDIINNYTLVEQQAPAGYFKENSVYTIEVKETIKLNELNNNGNPDIVVTTITVRDMNDVVVMSYTVEANDDNNGETRNLTLSDGSEFTVSKDADGNLTVTSGEKTLPWITTEPGLREANGKNYYFDPNAMMIVPVPDPITYKNNYGLLFKKVDINGATVNNVDIELRNNSGVVVGSDIWYWDRESTEWLIDYTKLTKGDEYTFVETFGGNKYDLADNITFKVSGDNQITYWIGSETEKAVTLDLTKDRVIRMENKRIVGVKPSLTKTKIDGTVIKATATFALYAEDGTEILNPVTLDENGYAQFDFSEYEAKTKDTLYVEGGYLKPGKYYLQELTAPEGFEAATRSFYFNVVEKADGSYEVVSCDGASIEMAWSTDSKPNYKVDEVIIYYIDGTSKTARDVAVTGGQYWYTFDIESAGLSPNNVIGMKIKLSGNDEGDKKFMVRNGDGDEIWGATPDAQWGDYTNMKPRPADAENPYYEFGTIPTEGEQIDHGPLITVSNKNDIKISNEEIKTTMDLRVDKKWIGDNGIPELRVPVTVKLQQKTGLDGTYADYPNGGATLNSENEWYYVWEDLPRFVNGENADGGLYYYQVIETSTVTGYESTIQGKDVNSGGTILVKNTADNIDIPVTKTWNYNGYDVLEPRRIKVKLQVDVDGNGNWVDVPGKELQLTQGKGWSGTFEGLIKGYKYQVVEVDVPFGWEVSNGAPISTNGESNNENVDRFTITNTFDIAEGSLAFQKLWNNIPQDAKKPFAIYLDLYRSVVAPSYTETDAPWTDTGEGKNPQGTDYKNDYARLLQHSLYFYDANMCGDDVSEKSGLAWRANCHTEDEVPGGYHDAGDHVMFGLPQGYTASMLSWIYLELFKDSTIDEADKAHLKTILDRFYEFFENSVKYDRDGNIVEILVQKGDGDGDHVEWGPPELQSKKTRTMIWSTLGSDIASEYAAALAMGYMSFRDTDKTKYNSYLELAEKLYAFAEGTSHYANEFYPGAGGDDDKKLAAAWIYAAKKLRNDSVLDTEDNLKKYKDARTTTAGKLQWDGVDLAAASATAYDTGNWESVVNWISSNYTNKDFYTDHEWGTARFNAIAQTATLIAAKHLKQQAQNEQDEAKKNELNTKADSFINWAVDQMNKILGENQWRDTIVKVNTPTSSTYGECEGGTVVDTNGKICFVTNFVPDGFDVPTPQAPHHRAASGWDTHEEYRLNCGYDEDGYTLIGALVGGAHKLTGNGIHTEQPQMTDYHHNHPTSNHSYIDDLHDYCCNEVAIDYNSGLVGAAAGLYYFFGTGKRSTKIEGVKFGSYGLTMPSGDIQSPVYSAGTESGKETESQSGSSQSFNAMKQTRVNVLGDAANLVDTIVASNDTMPFKSSVNGLENITSIEIEFENESNGYNGYISFVSGQDYGTSFGSEKCNNHVFTLTDGIPTKINYIQVGRNYSNVNVKEIRFYSSSGGTTPPPFAVEPESVSIAVDSSATLTANRAANWPNDMDGVDFTPSTDGKSCTVAISKYVNPFTINVSEQGGNGSDSVNITVTEATTSNFEINNINQTVYEGQEIQLGFSGTAVNNTVTWSLTDTNNQQFNNELSNLKIEGNTLKAFADLQNAVTVRIHASDSSGREVTKDVQINPISINGNGNLQVGDKPTYSLNNNVSGFNWSSSNPNVVSIDVNSGSAEAKAQGNNITISATKNNKTYATLNVNVSAAQAETSFSVTPEKYYLETGKSYELTITGGTDGITWNCGDSGITINGTTMTVGNTTGKFTITATKNGTSKSFNVVIGDYVKEVDIDYSNLTWETPITIPASPSEYQSYEVMNVGFKFTGRANDGEFKFAIDSYDNQTSNIKFSALPEDLHYTIDKEPENYVIYGSWSGKNIYPEKMFVIYKKPELAITVNGEATDEISMIEGETITLGQVGKAANSTVTWKNGDTQLGTGNSYDFKAPDVSENTEYVISASDGSATDSITITVQPLTIQSVPLTSYNTPVTLEMNTNRPLTDFTWSSSAPESISVENGVVKALKGGSYSATITATDTTNNIVTSVSISANIVERDLQIQSDSDTIGIGGELQLTQIDGPLNATYYAWSSFKESVATVDENGKVVGKSAGTATIMLSAYSDSSMTGEPLATATKDITITSTSTVRVPQDYIEGNGGDKYFYKLSDILPTGAILKRASVNVTPTSGNETQIQGAVMMGIDEGEVWNKMEINEQVPAAGKTFTAKDSMMNNIDCAEHFFCLGLWGSSGEFKVNWVEFEYEMDTTFIEIKYSDESTSQTIRKGETRNFTVNVGGTVGGTIESVVIKNGEKVVYTFDDVNAKTFTTPADLAAGTYTIEATVVDSEDNKESVSIALTVKDEIAICQRGQALTGTAMVDLNSSNVFTVINLLDEVEWSVIAEGYQMTTDGDVVTIYLTANGNENEKVATFNKETGELVTFGNGGSFSIIARDSHADSLGRKSEAEISVVIAERPKLPELPKKVFLEKVDTIEIILTEGNSWQQIVDKLWLTDTKGNKYYYYIQEAGYVKSQGGTKQLLNDDKGHFIYSSNAIFMPDSYFNNGMAPVENGSPSTLKVGNKFSQNYQGQLPSTGGSGVKTYYIFGGMIMLLSAAGFIGLKRRERTRR